MKITLSTIEEAVRYLESTQTEPIHESIDFSGELSKIELLIDGPRYHATVPGELARGLWEMQEALYKAATFALTGTEDLRRLTASQRQQLELVFQIQEGSSDIWAPLEGFFAALGDGFKSMSDTEKRRTLVAIAVVIAGGFLAGKALDGYFESQTQRIAAEAKLSELQVVRDIANHAPEVARFEKATEDGARSIIRGASDATELKFGRATFDSDQIQAINQRSARIPSSAETIQGDFRIFGADSHSDESTRYMLGTADGTEFAVTVNHSEFSAEDLERLWEAAKSRRTISLEVTLTTNRGAIRGAQIISLL